MKIEISLLRYPSIALAAILILLASSTDLLALPVPPKLIALNSQEGRALLLRSANESYFRLSEQFITQKTTQYCSIASMVMILNALGMEGPKDPNFSPYRPFTQENFFTPKINKIISEAKVSNRGLRLDETVEILKTFPLKVEAIHSDKLSLKKFRLLLKETLNSKNKFVILNYSHPALSQAGSGHFSPVAAYDEETDRFLVLDVARYKYPPVWVKTEDLWGAVNTLAHTKERLWRGVLQVGF